MDLWSQFLFVQLCPNTTVTCRWAEQGFDILHNFNATNAIACCFTHRFISHLRSIHATRSISFEHSHQYPFNSLWDEVTRLRCTTWTPSQRPTNYHYSQSQLQSFFHWVNGSLCIKIFTFSPFCHMICHFASFLLVSYYLFGIILLSCSASITVNQNIIVWSQTLLSRCTISFYLTCQRLESTRSRWSKTKEAIFIIGNTVEVLCVVVIN